MEKTEHNTPSVVPLERAIERLKEGMDDYLANTGLIIVRDGLVQRFEFTYELSHKTLSRFLERKDESKQQVRLSFQDLIRTACDEGLLLGDWQAWDGYRELRGKTSHTYGEKVALEVVEAVPEFIKEAEFLRDKLRERLP